jgi:anti-sigma-K factor RskA
LLLQVTAAVVAGKRTAAADVAAAAADTVVVRGSCYRSFGVGAVGRQLAVPAGAADRQPRQLVDFGLSFWNAVAAAVAIAVAAVVAVVAGRETQGIP